MIDRALGPKDVARAAGISTDTLRHYERKGLLPGVARTAAGYRRYSPAAVTRVLLIQRALVVGFSLSDLARVLNARDRGGAPCRSVRDLVGQRLADLERRVEELIDLRNELRTLLREWDTRLANTRAGQRAHLLDSLGETRVIEQARQTRPAGSRGRRQSF